MYIKTPRPSCLALLRQEVFFAAALAWAKTGKRMAARIAMIAMTTRSSISVKALDFMRSTVQLGVRGRGRGGASKAETTQQDGFGSAPVESNARPLF